MQNLWFHPRPTESICILTRFVVHLYALYTHHAILSLWSLHIVLSLEYPSFIYLENSYLTFRIQLLPLSPYLGPQVELNIPPLCPLLDNMLKHASKIVFEMICLWLFSLPVSSIKRYCLICTFYLLNKSLLNRVPESLFCSLMAEQWG